MEQPEYGSFTEYFDLDGQSAYFAIHPEIYPVKEGIAPTAPISFSAFTRVRGSCHFIIEQDEGYTWHSEHHPPCFDETVIAWMEKGLNKISPLDDKGEGRLRVVVSLPNHII